MVGADEIRSLTEGQRGGAEIVRDAQRNAAVERRAELRVEAVGEHGV